MAVIGAHVSGGIRGAVARAREIGAVALQIFVGSPQTWRPPSLPPAEVEAFRQGCAQYALGPIFVHGSYLVNLASVDPAIYAKSRAAVLDHWRGAETVGGEALIIHVGSSKGEPYAEAERRAIAALHDLLRAGPAATGLLLEICAGQGNAIGRRFAELGALIAACDHDPRLGVCLDTCHAFAAGYELRTPEGLEGMLEELDREVGLARLTCVHANDSKGALGSNVDRHENIGQGQLGEETFARLLAHPALRHLPFILEVPGYDGEGPDRENVATLRRLAGMR